MVLSSNLGYPRIGANRELKHALENYWKTGGSEAQLLETAREMRRQNWELQKKMGLDIIPSNDFSLYDQVLDTIAMLGAVPARFGWSGKTVDLGTYFAMARGAQGRNIDVQAMEMTKWFDTNYHYIVPEFEENQKFTLASTKAVDEFSEALDLGIPTRPVLLGPVSFLMLGRSVTEGIDPITLLGSLLPHYKTILHMLLQAGATWIQIDEPCLVLDLTDAHRDAYKTAYLELSTVPVKLMLTTYFEGLRDNLALATGLPVNGLHVDLVTAPAQLDEVLETLPASMVLSMGIVDGRNIWRTDLDRALTKVRKACETLGEERVIISSSCSLQFCPYDLELENSLDEELKSWLAFARQKVGEIAILQRAFGGDAEAIEQIAAQRRAIQSRLNSSRTNLPSVRTRLAHLTADMFRRKQRHSQRKEIQAQRIKLPSFPTTSIGSFPQTGGVRTKRAAFRRGEINQDQYEEYLRSEIEHTIHFQEEIGLDVLVHGESERSDMVEYFGQQLTGIAVTEHGWVQSYGSRGVRPPIIYGDVERPGPMTVAWSTFAQSLTDRPVKGMLTGPVTILEWSFVRDDQPRTDTCCQLALAIRDEVNDLEANGIQIIQVDEPALRQGLPLRRVDRDEYLRWAIECFRLATAGVKDDTQIHTHMCYAKFNDIMMAIEAMDADVISIETSRSKMELLNAFTQHHYPNDIGPGVYDVHSPRVPSQQEIEILLQKALDVIDSGQLWVNPDCGLKTRGWGEVDPALRNMVAAAHALREKMG